MNALMSELKTRLHALWQGWHTRTPKERNLITAGCAMTLAVLYGLLIHPWASQRIAEVEYRLEKMAVRSKTASKLETRAAPVPAVLLGKNPQEARQELAGLKRQIEQTRQEVAALRQQFVAMDDNLAMNTLKSGLTSLAEAGDMEVTAIEHVLGQREDKDKPPSVELIRAAAQANPYQRPLIILRARASFRGLMQFLEGLPQLPYVVAPVASDIVVTIERHPQTQAPLRQWLDVTIKLAV